MEKLDPKTDGATMNIVEENIEKLRELLPDAFTESSDENGTRLKVNFDALRELLGDYIEDGQERYSFNWNGKARARRIAQTPSTGTLRPCPEESANWDTTQNLFIEGDNLEVLKLLQKSYHKKVKMIYIDPPYNTGKDFIYPDNFRDNIENYLELTGQKDEEGRKLSANTETSGRFHTDWLNMMYPRLKLARNLLREDGLVFISIDDNESYNLRSLMNEVFGEENFIADVALVNNLKGRNDKKYIATANERLLIYVKSDEFEEFGLDLPDSKLKEYELKDKDGKYRLIELRKRGGADTRKERPKMFYPFYVNPETGNVNLEENGDYTIEALPIKSTGVEGRWRWGIDTAKNRLELLVGQRVNGKEKYNIYEKDYLEKEGTIKRIKPKSVICGTDYSTDGATKAYRALMPEADFSNPKPVPMIEDLVTYAAPPSDEEAIFLDLFSGSSTLAHAVISRNSKDNGRRNFICIQLPEKTEIDSEEFKNGFKTIAEIGKERIRRVIKKIEAEQTEKAKEAKEKLPGMDDSESNNLGLGFKVFKLDSSNIKPWDADFDNLEHALLNAVENIKPDRSEADVLYEILLKYGLDLTLPIEERKIDGKTVYIIGAGALVLCLADDISLDVVEGIAALKDELKPELMRVVFKDAGFKDDVVKTNAVQILRQADIEDVKSL